MSRSVSRSRLVAAATLLATLIVVGSSGERTLAGPLPDNGLFVSLAAGFDGSAFPSGQDVSEFGHVDGPALSARFSSAGPMAFKSNGDLFIGDNAYIRRLDGNGQVSTFAGTGVGLTDGVAVGPVSTVAFEFIKDLKFDSSGQLFVADNFGVRKVAVDGVVSFVTQRQTFRVLPLDDGSVLVSGGASIGIVTSPGATGFNVTPWAGSGGSGFLDGPRLDAQFGNVSSLARGLSGDVFVADGPNARVRRITSDGIVSTFAGSGTSAAVDGGSNSSSFLGPQSVGVATNGDVFVADYVNSGAPARIRRISNSAVSTVAGGGTDSYALRTIGPALGNPTYKLRELAVAANGEVFFVVSGDRIKKLGLPITVLQESRLRRGSVRLSALSHAQVRIVAWGENYGDPLGLGSSVSTAILPMFPSNGPSTGFSGFAAQDTNSYGVLAALRQPLTIVTSRTGSPPFAIPSGTVIRVASGDAHSLALLSTGVVLSQGSNSAGARTAQTFDAGWGTELLPVPMKAIAARTYSSAAVSTIGDLWMWGSNSGWEYPDRSPGEYPRKVAVSPNTESLIDVSLGADHNLVLTATGEVFAWGANDCGQLGIGSTGAVTGATKVAFPNGIKIVSVDAGLKSSVALDDSGEVWDWGCGSGKRPGRVDGVENAVQVAAGSQTAYAVTGEGFLYSWGANFFGQLGDGTTVPRRDPRPVLNPSGTDALRNVISVSAGNNSARAVVDPDAPFVLGASVEKMQLGRLQASFAQPAGITPGTEQLLEDYAVELRPSSFDWDKTKFVSSNTIRGVVGIQKFKCLTAKGVQAATNVSAGSEWVGSKVTFAACGTTEEAQKNIVATRAVNISRDAASNIVLAQSGTSVVLRRFSDTWEEENPHTTACLTAPATGSPSLQWRVCEAPNNRALQEFDLATPLPEGPRQVLMDRVANPADPAVAATGRIFINDGQGWNRACTGTLASYATYTGRYVFLVSANHCMNYGTAAARKFLFVPGMDSTVSGTGLVYSAPYGVFGFNDNRIGRTTAGGIANDVVAVALFPQVKAVGNQFVGTDLDALFTQSLTRQTTPSPANFRAGSLPLQFPRVVLPTVYLRDEELRVSRVVALGYPEMAYGSGRMTVSKNATRRRIRDGSTVAEMFNIGPSGTSGGPLLQRSQLIGVKSAATVEYSGGGTSRYTLLNSIHAEAFNVAIAKAGIVG